MRKLFATMLLLSALSTNLWGQEEKAKPLPKFECCFEQMPSFPGGTEAWLQFLADNLQWPQEHAEDCWTGFVICKFKVQKDGTRTDFAVIKSLEECFDREALRVLHLMPKWIPAQRGNNPVECTYTVKIRFGT